MTGSIGSVVKLVVVLFILRKQITAFYLHEDDGNLKISQINKNMLKIRLFELFKATFWNNKTRLFNASRSIFMILHLTNMIGCFRSVSRLHLHRHLATITQSSLFRSPKTNTIRFNRRIFTQSMGWILTNS